MEAPNNLSDTGHGVAFLEGKKYLKMTQLETGIIASDFLLVDDLLDFSNEEIAGPIGEDCSNDVNGVDTSTITETETVVCCRNNSNEDNRKSSHNSSTAMSSNVEAQNLAEDLTVPCDELAQLEWLSNFVEDSFSTGNCMDIELSVVSSGKNSYAPEFFPVPGRARSKRSRAPVCNWVSGILSPISSATKVLNASASTPFSSESSEQGGPESSSISKMSSTNQGWTKKKALGQDTCIRKCTHCGTQKTPQWRAGPKGPKTLCNACGVRFKSGRLLPEYRPAASPTFVLTKHSNSHRKVLEMRRQKTENQNQHHPNIEKLVQGLMHKSTTSSSPSEHQSYFDRSDDQWLLHNSTTREDNFCY